MSCEIDLEMLSQQISQSTTVTRADCQVIIYGLVAKVSRALEQGQIVRLRHQGSFQVSVKGMASESPEEVTNKKVKRVSLI
jgi:nucleoid DNA-binding protein